MASTIRVRATSTSDTTEVQVLIQHPMDSGFIQDAQGPTIPPHCIQHVTFAPTRHTIFVATLAPAASGPTP